MWRIRLHDGDLERIRSHRAQTTARRARLPDRHPDGRFSAPGLARSYDVNEGTVRNWIRRGLFRVDYEAFGVYTRIRWLTLNEDHEPELREWVDRIRRRRAARNRSKHTTS